MGRPVLHGGLSAKQMMAAVYSVPSDDAVTLEVYITDGLEHCHEVCVQFRVYMKYCVRA